VAAEVGREPGADPARCGAALGRLGGVTNAAASRDERKKGGDKQPLHDTSLDVAGATGGSETDVGGMLERA
jgi:hypothetical protein